MTLSTGVREIDRTFDGGIPAGSLVVLTSPPEAQVDPLLNASVHIRDTLYFTTVRTESAVRDELDRVLTEPQIDAIHNVGVDGALVDILASMADLDEREDVIVDIFDPLEAAADRQEYVTFLNDFTDRLQDTDSIGIVHCLSTDDDPANRKYTMAAADFIWELNCRRQSSKLSYELSIPKASGITLSDEDRILDLELGRSVAIDTSRDIA